jgi:actin-related protein 6
VKEEVCYVSEHFVEDMEYITDCNNTVHIGGAGPLKTQSTIRKFFVMPDFQTINRGYVKPEGEAFKQGEQLLMLESERFAVPEVLFHPSDIGMEQAGVVEAASQCLSGLSKVN